MCGNYYHTYGRLTDLFDTFPSCEMSRSVVDAFRYRTLVGKSDVCLIICLSPVQHPVILAILNVNIIYIYT